MSFVQQQLRSQHHLHVGSFHFAQRRGFFLNGEHVFHSFGGATPC